MTKNIGPKAVPSTLMVAVAILNAHPTWKLFPLAPGTKDRPLIDDNLDQASSALAVIEAWSKKFKGCGWGIALKNSKLIVVDVDVKPGKVGSATILDHELDGRDLPPTYEVRSPSGGRHVYYNETPTAKHRFDNKGKIFGKDVDSPNYVLAAGCKLSTGGMYTLVNDAPVADAPAWFDDLLGAVEPERVEQIPEVEQDTDAIRQWCIDYLTNDAPIARQGDGGDATTYQVFATLKDKGASEAMAVELAAEFWNDRCEPPWQGDDGPEKDRLSTKARNAYAYAKENAPGSDTPEAEFGPDPAEPLTGDAAKGAAEGARQQAKIKTATDRWRAALNAHVLCLNPVAFIERDSKVALGPGQIDAAYSHIINRLNIAARYKDKAAKLAIGTSDGIKRVDGMCYRPGRPQICIELRRVPGKLPRQVELFNMWVDPCVEPLPGDPQIFLEHLRYLIPNKRERILFANWLAHLVQHPNDKIMYAILIVGLERTGKSWLGYMLRKLLGFDNVAMVGNEDPIGDTFNGWTENKLLGVIHELAPAPKIDLVARVKPIITEPEIQVNEKYIKRHRAENACHILAISNHDTSVKMLRKDPRWLVIRAADDPFGVDDDGEATPKFDAYYKRLFDAIGPLDDPTPTDEVQRIKGWLLRRDVSKFIRSIAPSTETRHEIADAGGTEVANQVNELYRSRSAPFLPGRTLVTPAEVVDCLSGQERALRDNPLAVLNLTTAAMTALGCRKVTDRVRVGGKEAVRLWCVNRKLADKYKAMDGTAVAAIYKRERADAGKKLDKEAAENAASDFTEAAE